MPITSTINPVLATPVSVANGGTGITTRPAFKAVMSSNQTLAAADTPEKINFDTEVYDIGNCYDTTNKRWTPIAETTVDVVFSVSCYVNEVAGNNVYIKIYKNGSLLLEIRDLQVNTGPESHVLNIQDRANGSTDYYEVWGEDSSVTNRDFFATANRNWFCGMVVP